MFDWKIDQISRLLWQRSMVSIALMEIAVSGKDMDQVKKQAALDEVFSAAVELGEMLNALSVADKKMTLSEMVDGPYFDQRRRIDKLK